MQLSWYNLLKSGYFHIFTKIWTLPCLLCTCAQWAWVGTGPKIFTLQNVIFLQFKATDPSKVVQVSLFAWMKVQ